MTRVKLETMVRFLVALALVISTVECAAACTPSSSAEPACHHHKKLPPAPCSHELVPATIVQHVTVDVLISPEALVQPFTAPRLIAVSQPVLDDSSPPGPRSTSLFILRI